jgi:hypothetical protein
MSHGMRGLVIRGTEIAPAVFESCISSKKFKALSEKMKSAVPESLK